jgi:hypothetical protein
MATREKPPRPWDIDDLLDTGKGTGVTYLKAVPILILEAWVQGERKEGVANFVRTNNVARRLVDSGLVSGFGQKGTSNVLGALAKMQSGRNLTRPPLVEYQGGGMSWVNLPHYEPLLQEYRGAYRERFQEDYRKLFPEGEPEWEPPPVQEKQAEQKKNQATSFELLRPDSTQSLLSRLERAIREREQVTEGLARENRQLRNDLAALQASGRMIADEELRNDCVELLANKKYYIDAIRRASVVLETRLKEAVGATKGDMEYGTGLVSYALNKESGKLIISSHPAEQEGVHLLFLGAFAFVRNPPAHKKIEYTEVEAWQVISLIDYLLSLLGQARPREGVSGSPSRIPG